MGKQATIKQQATAYNEYHILLLKKHIREVLQLSLVTRENELAQSDHNEAIEQQYLGYRMALEDIYYALYEEELPEPTYKTEIDFGTVDV